MFPEGCNSSVGSKQSLWGNYYFIPDVFYPYFRTGNTSILEKDSIYAGSRSFASWFYRRGLEVLFISLLRGMIATSLFYHYQIMGDEEAANLQINQSMREGDERFCYYLTRHKIFEFYYKDEHPLDSFVPVAVPNVLEKCNNYHNSLESNKLYPRSCIISDGELSYEAFLKMYKGFGTR